MSSLSLMPLMGGNSKQRRFQSYWKKSWTRNRHFEQILAKISRHRFTRASSLMRLPFLLLKVVLLRYSSKRLRRWRHCCDAAVTRLWRSAVETSSRLNKAEARLEKMQQRCLKNSGHASAESFKAFARVFTTCSIRKKKSPEHFKGKQKMSYNCLGGPSCDVVVHALLLLLLLSCDALVVVRWCRACVL